MELKVKMKVSEGRKKNPMSFTHHHTDAHTLVPTMAHFHRYLSHTLRMSIWEGPAILKY